MIIMTRNHLIYENDYNPKHKEYRKEEVVSLIPFLNNVIQIEPDVTLYDFFHFLSRDKSLIQTIFASHMGHFLLSPYLEELEKNYDEKEEENSEKLVCIELSWIVDSFCYSEFYNENKDNKELNRIFGEPSPPTKESDNKNEIDIYIDVHGIGDDPDRTFYGIEFTPLYKLKDLPIHLNTNFKIKKRNVKSKNKKPKILIEGEKEFSVYDVIGSILSEITFCGFPEDRDDRWEEIKNSYEDIKEDLEEEDDNE